MISYYGSKIRVASVYPAPKYDTVIEPFAGSAQYSLLHFEKNVVLYEKYDRLFRVWKYLQEASPSDILALPSVKRKTIQRHAYLTEAENDIVSFCGNRGTPKPHKTTGNYSNAETWWENRKKWIAENLYRIRHWDIILGDGMDAENRVATWFIDPPYQHGGRRYVHNKIDYPALGEWSKSRLGQVIVCENDKADWMEFVPLKRQYAQRGYKNEMIYYQETDI